VWFPGGFSKRRSIPNPNTRREPTTDDSFYIMFNAHHEPNPTLPDHGHSPYHSPSAFAFNPLLISPLQMVKDGYLDNRDLDSISPALSGCIDYETVSRVKEKLFQKAFQHFRPSPDFDDFCHRHSAWLDDYALFTALGNHFNNRQWHLWPENIRIREPAELEYLKKTFSEEISYVRFTQYLFACQWQKIKDHAAALGIQILGDMPIYVPHESADVWVNPGLFKLDGFMSPMAVSGVPPDYFSKTGQLWGHPVFDWKAHSATGFDWWVRRVRHNLAMYDYLRIDHFRGLVAYWEIPAHEETAINGRWREVPVRDLFDTLFRAIPRLPIIAEDLGYITADVREVIRDYNIPGMRVLVFGFADSPAKNDNAPHNIDSRCVVYTGTHDTNTAKGWHDEESGETGKKQIARYFGRNLDAGQFADELVRMAQMSRAWLCIFPVQDLLALGSESRVNRPGSSVGNWQWRLTGTQLKSIPWEELQRRTAVFGRT
jgi:4-alpha-glucanotransferase